jgi:MinD-like ATPase involved in chromosome partitioning or flagellar assembly
MKNYQALGNYEDDTHLWVIYRYGEVLLNYAEALNEVADFILIDTGAGISDQVLEFVMASPEVLLVSTPYEAITQIFLQD